MVGHKLRNLQMHCGCAEMPHYRLVLGVVGHALTTFKCTRELVSAVLDALIGESNLLYMYARR